MAVCPKCGEENPERARFCLACGAELVKAAPPREVRKTVTILFCDVTGSTALGERLDPESLRHVMARYFDEAQAVLERHGGSVEKFIGDAVMAVFGVPVLHEDDALRAVRAAAELRDRLTDLRDELGLETRIGVNTGEVVSGAGAEGQKLVTGDAVNVAARLEQAAAPGQVLIGRETYGLVRDAVEVEAVARLELKGKSTPVEAFLLVAVTPLAPGRVRRLDSPMVGRDDERGLLEGAFERTVRERACNLFTVLGPAGVGKSRLVAEFLVGVGDRATLIRGRCLAYGEGITYWPLAEALRQLAGEDSPTMVEKLVQGEPDAELVAQRVSAALGLVETTAGGEETFWAVRKLFEAQARERPLIIVFDDVHWAEPTFLDLIEHVTDWSRNAPILLVCMARPELLDARPAWGGGKLNATSILLEALRGEDCTRLIEHLLGAAKLDDDSRERIAEAAEGNPLFVEELLGMLIDDGLLRRDNGRWIAAADLSEIAVPPTIQALLAARLDRLEATVREVIGSAAVEGSLFHRGAVQALAPGQDVPRHLLALVRKELIRPDQGELPGEDAFRFRHLLIRDAAYESLPKRTRAELHQRFAEWLEQAVGERVREYEEIVGYHLEQAYRFRIELGPADEEAEALARQGAERLAAAGRRALGRGDMPAAANLLQRAISLLGQGDSLWLELMPELGDALTSLGDFDRAEELLTEAIEAASAAGREQAELHGRLARAVLRTYSDPEGSLPELQLVAERSVPVFERARDDRGLARAWAAIGWRLHTGNRFQEASEAYGRALVHARRAGDERRVNESLHFIGTSLLYGPVEAEATIERARELLERERPAVFSETSFTDAIAVHEAMRGRFDAARELLARGRANYAELGLTSGIDACSVLEHAFVVEMLAGEHAVAEREIRSACEMLEQFGEKGLLSTQAARLAQALYAQGRYEEAERQTEVSEEAGASDDIATQVTWRQVRAKTLARRGELERAEQLAQEAVALSEPTDALDMRGDALLDLGEVLRLAGKPEGAQRAFERALALHEQKGNVVSAQRGREALQSLAGA
ncbi:MAG: AAA family ATPase [Actinomycetota bacterium]|nr:AAA family ATPase [Actinomycetota bacterium]